ncbi:MAG: hypothetical protein AAF236_03480 [Verrucomicrobiota bacterium]
MQKTYEIQDRFIEPGDASGLLYEPLSDSATFVSTRRYHLEFKGHEAAADEFVRDTLLDPISQSLSLGEGDAVEGASFVLEYGMKPGALDLEKEAILAHFAGIEEPGWSLTGLTIQQRIYLFDTPPESADRFVRDICNAAIHHWTVIPAADHA